VLLVLPLISCTARQGPFWSTTSKGPASEATLQSRAETLWTAKVEEDWKTAFLFLDPRQRAETTEAEFTAWSQENDPLKMLSYSVERVQIAGDLGWVEVHYRAAVRKYPDLPPRDAHQWQKWRLVAGHWYPVRPQEWSSYPAAPALRDAEEETRLRSRFLESWDARHADRWSELYEMSDPRDKDDVPVEEFVDAESRFAYLSYELHWVEVQGDRGSVRVSYRHKVTDPSLTKLLARVAVLTEHWKKRDGQWYRDLIRSN